MGNLATPKSVQKLQTALHAKAKAEAGYRFYALHDKISRDDILAHAYAQCRSNKGAPGVDGQDFADIEAHGVGRWLAELALALREETYRPEPIRRVYIPKASLSAAGRGKLARVNPFRSFMAATAVQGDTVYLSGALLPDPSRDPPLSLCCAACLEGAGR